MNKNFKLIFISMLILGLLISCAGPKAEVAKPEAKEASASIVMKIGAIWNGTPQAAREGFKEMAASMGIEVVEAEATDVNDAVLKANKIANQVSGILFGSEADKAFGEFAKSTGLVVVTLGHISNPKVDDIDIEVVLEDYDIAFQSLKNAILEIGGVGKMLVVNAGNNKSEKLRMDVLDLMHAMYPVIEIETVAPNNVAGKEADIVWASEAAYVPEFVDDVNVDIFAAGSDVTEVIYNSLAANNKFRQTTFHDYKEAGRVAARALVSAINGDKLNRYVFITANVLNKSDAIAGVKLEGPVVNFAFTDFIWERFNNSNPSAAAVTKEILKKQIDELTKGNPPDLPRPLEISTDFKVKTLTIGSVHHRTNYQHNELLRGGMDEIASMFNVELIKCDAQSDYAAMTDCANQLLTQGIDALFIDHGTTDVCTPIAESAIKKGVPVLTFDCPIPEVQNQLVAAELAQDDYGHAFLGIREMISSVGGKGKVGVVWIGGSIPLGNRYRVLEMFLKHYTDLEVIDYGERSANVIADTMDKTEAVLRANPEIKAFWATFDQMATGVHEALKQNNRLDIPLFSVDLSSEDVARMAETNSPWKMTGASDASEIGRAAILYLIQAAYGQDTPRYVRIPAFAITQDIARQTPMGTLPTPKSPGIGWTPFMVALYELVNK